MLLIDLIVHSFFFAYILAKALKCSQFIFQIAMKYIVFLFPVRYNGVAENS